MPAAIADVPPYGRRVFLCVWCSVSVYEMSRGKSRAKKRGTPKDTPLELGAENDYPRNKISS